MELAAMRLAAWMRGTFFISPQFRFCQHSRGVICGCAIATQPDEKRDNNVELSIRMECVTSSVPTGVPPCPLQTKYLGGRGRVSHNMRLVKQTIWYGCTYHRQVAKRIDEQIGSVLVFHCVEHLVRNVAKTHPLEPLRIVLENVGLHGVSLAYKDYALV
jgi:hypothetical protein